MAYADDVQTLEVMVAVDLLRELEPDPKIRAVNLVDRSPAVLNANESRSELRRVPT